MSSILEIAGYVIERNSAIKGVNMVNIQWHNDRLIDSALFENSLKIKSYTCHLSNLIIGGISEKYVFR